MNKLENKLLKKTKAIHTVDYHGNKMDLVELIENIRWGCEQTILDNTTDPIQFIKTLRPKLFQIKKTLEMNKEKTPSSLTHILRQLIE